MKKYKDLSVKVKIPLMVGVASLVALALICVLLLRPLRSTALEEAASVARLTAISSADRLREEINSQASILRAYSDIIVDLAESGVIRVDRRRQFMFTGLESFVQNGKISNVWILMEPNVLDGIDSLFAGKTGNTAQGSVAAWFLRGKMLSADSPDNIALYNELKAAKQELVTEPYKDIIDGREAHIISVSIPIMYNGKFYGIIGTDFNLEELYGKVASLNTIGQGKLVTSSGIAAASYRKDRIGEPVEYGNREILDKLPAGKMFEGFWKIQGEMQYKVYVPVKLVNNNDIWFYAVDVPYDTIYKDVRSTTFNLIIYCLIGVFLITFAGWFLVQPILKKVGGLTGVIRKLSLGHINIQIDDTNEHDELGIMNSELGHLVEGLKRSTSFAHNIGEGKLDAEFRMLSDGDVLGNSLLEMRQSLQKADTEQAARKKEEEQRNWGTAGLAKFAEILRRDNDNMEVLAYNIIVNLVEYLGINQGGIFVMNDAEQEADRVLELKGCYAYDRQKFLQKQILPGEGLVGACYMEGKPIYMTDVPNDYISIKSGLGGSNPKTVLITPLRVNDEKFGVIELASFRELEPYQLEFVQKVSESIAATISTVNINIRTNKLLAQSKEQAEQMANAEEELRQNMEEMQATHEEMRRRETEMQTTMERSKELQQVAEKKEHESKQINDAIYATCNMVEFSPDGYINNVNDNYCQLFEANRSSFVGKHLKDFISVEAYDKAESAVDAGKIYEDVQRITAANGKSRMIIQRFIPVFDNSGKQVRVLMLAFPDDTEEIRQSEEELRQNLEEMKATQDELSRSMAATEKNQFEAKQVNDAIFATCNVVEFSSDFIITDANKNISDLLGIPREIAIGKPMSMFVGEKAFAEVKQNIGAGKVYEDTQQVQTGSGKTRTVVQRFIPINDKDGKMMRVLMLVFPDDTEELRQSEEELRQNMEEMQTTQEELTKAMTEAAKKELEMQQFYNAILETCNVVEYSADAIITDVNANFLKIFIADKSNFIGQHMSAFVGEEAFKTIYASLQAGKIYEDAQHLDMGEGRTKTIIQRCIPIQDGDGKLQRILMLAFPDDTEELRRTMAITEASQFESKQTNDAVFATCNVIEFSPDYLISDVNKN
jgi:methyl-accepting chemotaxis protein